MTRATLTTLRGVAVVGRAFEDPNAGKQLGVHMQGIVFAAVVVGWIVVGCLNVRFSNWFWGPPAVFENRGISNLFSFLLGPFYWVFAAFFACLVIVCSGFAEVCCKLGHARTCSKATNCSKDNRRFQSMSSSKPVTMKLSVKPDQDMTVKVLYNGKEIFSQDVQAGKQYDWEIEIPQVSGTATVYLVIDGEWGWAGEKDYKF